MRKLTLALGATAALVGGTTFVLAQAQAQQPSFSAYPMPGTLTVSARTDLSFRGGDAAALGTVKVTGSESGDHAGTLKAHPDGQGVSFVPAKAFTAGEKVTVTTGAAIVNATNGDYSFNVGVSTGRKNRFPESPDVGRGQVQKFATREDLTPPAVTVSTAEAGRASGLVFISPKSGRGQDGPMIINDKGQTLYFRPTPGKIPADFRVQTYLGKPVLTWWQGQLYGGDGDGEGIVLDEAYKQVATIHAAKGYSLDLHEVTITPRNTALVLSYERYKRDLRQWGGQADARIVDNVVQEVDIKTGAVLFEWHAFGNVSPADSYTPVPAEPGFEWEYFHVNAAEITPDGNILISARNTSTLYKINRQTGKIMWRLGGKKSDFKLGPGVRFDFQHSSRTLPDGSIRLYDNSAAPPQRKASRAITVKLDEQAKTATLVSAFTHPRKLLAGSQGDVETLPNGNLFVGWGAQRYFTEFTPQGKIVFDGRIARGNDSYRAFRFPWVGKPTGAPKVVYGATTGTVQATVSWNGATEVARWELLGGAAANALAPVASAPFGGFETALSASPAPAFVAVRAVDAAGNVLATTPAIRPGT